LQEPDSQKLLRLVGSAEDCDFEAYSVRNLGRSPLTGREQTSKVTIEFRQHEATLDGDRIAAWVKTVVGLLVFADDCDPFFLTAFVTEYASLMDKGQENPYMIVDLLRDIGLNEPTDYYEATRPDLSVGGLNDWDRIFKLRESLGIEQGTR
jgi:hypothetical protein